MRAMQCTHFCAKIAKNDLKPTIFLKSNFYFEMEGVSLMWFGVAPRANTRNTQFFKRYWIVCSKYDSHSKLNNQHNLG
jgi:hypothetical protein